MNCDVPCLVLNNCCQQAHPLDWPQKAVRQLVTLVHLPALVALTCLPLPCSSPALPLLHRRCTRSSVRALWVEVVVAAAAWTSATCLSRPWRGESCSALVPPHLTNTASTYSGTRHWRGAHLPALQHCSTALKALAGQLCPAAHLLSPPPLKSAPKHTTHTHTHSGRPLLALQALPACVRG